MDSEEKQDQTSKLGFNRDGKRDSLRRKHSQPEIETQHPTLQKNTAHCTKAKERYPGNKKRHTEYRHEKHERRKNHRHDTRKEDRRNKEIDKVEISCSDKKYSTKKEKKKSEKEVSTNTEAVQKKQPKKIDLGTKSEKKRVSSEESREESARKKLAVKDENIKVPETEHVEEAKETQGVSITVSSEKKEGSQEGEKAKAVEVEVTTKGEKKRKHKRKDKRGAEGEHKGEMKRKKKKKEQKEDKDEASGNVTERKQEKKQEAKKIMKEDEKKDNPSNTTEKGRVHIPWLDGCRSVDEFKCLNRIEEGTYGVVYRGEDKRTNKIVALKRIKLEKEREGFPITYLREINTLLKLRHPNVITVQEIVVGSDIDKIFIVMDYVEHDLKSLMEIMKKKKSSFTTGEVKCLMEQLLSAIQFLHDNWILHRDLKTSNLLLSHRGILKVGDFGLAREYGSPLNVYTPVVVTLWYRAPELLLGSEKYSTPVDMWSIGCIFAELLTMKPLFPGEGEVSQINLVYKILGTPNDTTLPGFSDLPAVRRVRFPTYPSGQLREMFLPPLLSELGFDLLNSFFAYDPRKRIKACNAKEHEYFDETPRAISPSMFPTWPAKSESEHSMSRPKQPVVAGSSINLIKAGRFFIPPVKVE